MSWLFIVYIILNVEIQAKSQWNMGLIVLMIIEAMAVGMYEELVFSWIDSYLFAKRTGRL